LLASLLVALAHAEDSAWQPSASLAIDATRANATNGGDAQLEVDLVREGEAWKAVCAEGRTSFRCGESTPAMAVAPQRGVPC
jgi:hypothetical protein